MIGRCTTLQSGVSQCTSSRLPARNETERIWADAAKILVVATWNLNGFLDGPAEPGVRVGRLGLCDQVPLTPQGLSAITYLIVQQNSYFRVSDPRVGNLGSYVRDFAKRPTLDWNSLGCSLSYLRLRGLRLRGGMLYFFATLFR